VSTQSRSGRSHSDFGWRGVGVLALLVAVAMLTSLMAPVPAVAINRNTVLARAQTWIDNPVPYSQSKWFGGYRTDCSGYVSMVWQLGYSTNTREMHSVSFKITTAQLKPGDAMLKAGSHVRMFYGWADDAHTSYFTYEQTGPNTKSNVKNLAADLADGYIPYRYNKITDSPATWNAALNPAFNVWANGTPAWWSKNFSGLGPNWQVRTDTIRSGKFALGLINPSPLQTTFAEAQLLHDPIESGKTYTLTTWASTTTNPTAVEMRLQAYNATNVKLAETTTKGDAWGIGAGALKPMTIVMPMPAGATNVTTSLRLTGSTSPAGASGGTAAFDDVTLEVSSPRPVYRFYNRRNGSHFYSATGSERDVVADTMTSTYTYEGVAYGVSTSAANSAPLYRFFNRKNGSHFYTASVAERDRVKSKLSGTYTFEGVAYNVSSTPVAGSASVYRFYNRRNGSHFYTISVAERDSVRSKLSGTYTYEGAGFYLAP